MKFFDAGLLISILSVLLSTIVIFINGYKSFFVGNQNSKEKNPLKFFPLIAIGSLICIVVTFNISVLNKKSAAEQQFNNIKNDIARSEKVIDSLLKISNSYAHNDSIFLNNSAQTFKKLSRNKADLDRLINKTLKQKYITGSTSVNLDSLENVSNAIGLRKEKLKTIYNLDIADDGSLINFDSPKRKTIDASLEISGFTNSAIPLNKGDYVFLSGSGNIRLGALVGNSGPEGIRTGFLGLALENYNIVNSINHGALMVKLSEAEDWQAAGKSYRFTADKDGVLYFAINDNNLSENSGHYTVNVKVYR